MTNPLPSLTLALHPHSQVHMPATTPAQAGSGHSRETHCRCRRRRPGPSGDPRPREPSGRPAICSHWPCGPGPCDGATAPCRGLRGPQRQLRKPRWGPGGSARGTRGQRSPGEAHAGKLGARTACSLSSAFLAMLHLPAEQDRSGSSENRLERGLCSGGTGPRPQRGRAGAAGSQGLAGAMAGVGFPAWST